MTVEQALVAIEDVEGWLAEDQARRLWDAAGRVPAGGQIVEIGSFRGRSAIVLARAAAPDTAIVAIDPHQGSDRGPQEYAVDHALGDCDRDAFEANLVNAGVRDRIRHVRRESGAALGDVDGPIDMLYIDGAHRFAPARDDIRRWGGRVAEGGTLLIHDAFSSVGVTLAIAAELLASGGWRYAGRSRSLAQYERLHEPAAPVARVVNVARQLASLPWFARNLAIKAAILLGRQRLALALGHRAGDPWPY
jgi:predicted O-methyltransferase YrrM